MLPALDSEKSSFQPFSSSKVTAEGFVEKEIVCPLLYYIVLRRNICIAQFCFRHPNTNVIHNIHSSPFPPVLKQQWLDGLLYVWIWLLLVATVQELFFSPAANSNTNKKNVLHNS